MTVAYVWLPSLGNGNIDLCNEYVFLAAFQAASLARIKEYLDLRDFSYYKLYNNLKQYLITYRYYLDDQYETIGSEEVTNSRLASFYFPSMTSEDLCWVLEKMILRFQKGQLIKWLCFLKNKRDGFAWAHMFYIFSQRKQFRHSL